MAATHTRTFAQRALRRAQIARMAAQGLPATEIAAAVGMSVRAAEYHLRKIRDHWEQSTLEVQSSMKMAAYRELQEVQKEAWAAWDLSAGRVRVPVDKNGLGNGEDEMLEDDDVTPNTGASAQVTIISQEGDMVAAVDAIVMKRLGHIEEAYDLEADALDVPIELPNATRPGDPRYLRIVLDVIAAKRELFGTDAPKKSIELTITPADLQNMSDEQLADLREKMLKGGQTATRAVGFVAATGSVE